MLQWEETQVARRKLAYLPDKFYSVKLFTRENLCVRKVLVSNILPLKVIFSTLE